MTFPLYIWGTSENPRPEIQLATETAMTVRMIMILLYGAGGVPGRGEIPMSSVSSRTPVDFLFCILGSMKNEMQRREPQKVF